MGIVRFVTPFLLIALGCVSPSGPPQYMTDAVNGEKHLRRALSRMQDELGEEFKMRVVDDLFFIAANGEERALDAAETTIRRMTEELYDHYFTRRPTQPIRVYCFRNRSTYEEYVRRAHGRAPTTPYGFYLSSERKTVLNLATGLGTLAHEIVHPLLCEDFPGVPAWFNEGFASMFESTEDSSGRKLARNNWRLNDLRRATREGRIVPLRTLMETNTDEFYGDDRGVHYAMARYFCVYLQRQDLLVRFYREFRATVNDDASGIAALERVSRKSLADFEAEWRSWLDEMRYPTR